MRTWKKLSILLALCMTAILVLAACGPKGGGEKPTEAQTEAKTEEVTTEEATTKEAEPVDTGYPAATLTADTYTNEAINLKMTVPSTWGLYSAEELASEYNDGATEPAVGATFYEAFAQKIGGGDNVSIIVQNATGQTDTIKSLGIKDFTEMISDGIPEALEGAGATNIKYGLIDIDFPLDEYACIGCTCELQGTNIVQRQVVFLEGNYLYSITVTAFAEDAANTILDFFSKIK